MAPTIPGTDDPFVPDPEDWPPPGVETVTPEALTNEEDDLAASLPEGDGLPPEADEADVIEQRLDGGRDELDELREG